MLLDSRLLNLARSNRLQLVVAIVMGLSGGMLTILQAYWLSKIIHGVYLAGQTIEEASIYLVPLFFVIILRAGVTWAGEVAASKVSLRIKTTLRKRLFHHLLSLGPGYSQGERTGELIHTTVEGVESLDAYFSQYLPQLCLAALIPLTILLFVFPLDLLSGFILLLTAPLIPVFMVLIGNLADSMTHKQWQTMSRMSAYFLDVLQGLTTLKIFGRSREQIKVIAAVSDRYRDATMQVLKVAFLSALSLELIATLSTAIIAVEIGLRLLYSPIGNGILGISFEQAFFILLLAPEFYLPLRLLGTRFHAGMSGAAAAARVFEILETPAAICFTDPSNAGSPSETVQAPGVELPPSIKFSNISFTYPDGRPALKAVSFDVRPGEKIALVGPSGAGKSTLVQLLLRFVTAQEGQIFIDQEPLERIPPEQWWKKVSWVSQNPYLFNNTVSANLQFGRTGASMDALIEAAKKARAHDFITGLPQGYETVIGERGIRLSGGEAQRLALARAFLKDSPVIILDEPSTHLDPETEADLFSGILQLLEGRTVLIIAHRMATVMDCDRVLVLEKGHLVENGQHSSLYANEGTYRSLVRASLEANIPPGTLSNENYPDPQNALDIRERRDPFIETDQTVQLHNNLPVLFRLLSLLAPYKQQVLLSVLLGFATIGSAVGLLGTSAYIISAAARQPSIADLQVAIVGVRFFGISRAVFRYLERLVSHQVSFNLLSNLRVWFYSAVEPLAPARLVQFQSGNLFSRITSDITALENFYVRAAAPPMTALLVAAGTAALLSFFSPSLALSVLFFMALLGLGLPLWMRQLGRHTGLELQKVRAEMNTLLIDGIQGMSDLLAYGQRQQQEKLVGTASLRLSSLQNSMAFLQALQYAFISLLSNLAMLVVLILAIPLVSGGQVDGVYLAVLVLVALSSFEAIQPLPLTAQYLESHIEAGRRLFEIVDCAPEVIDIRDPLPIPVAPSLAVHDLSFAYPIPGTTNAGIQSATVSDSAGAKKFKPFVLQELSLELTPAKRMAIVGPTGSGKTTLTNLLLRFWEYGLEGAGSGWISLNGFDLKNYDQNELRNLFGVVSQYTFLFHASIRDNLLIASPGASNEKIYAAAHQADIYEFIESLPQGYDTRIGEGGLKISAGERRRLSIARAILKNAPFLILDEPTANLDSISEMRVLASMRELMEGRSTLMITHRLVGMEWMDEILVIKAGREIERGRHKDLLEANGLYRRMWELQNQLLQEAASTG
jgi:ATP-binding cassette, subfamily C, bacterial CydCD